MQRFILLITLLLVYTTSPAQIKYSKKQLIEDLDILKRNLEQNHAGLYLYSDQQTINQWFVKAKTNLTDSMTAKEFYKVLAPLNSVIKNGHTAVRYARFGNDFQILPLRLYKYKKQFYILDVFIEEYEYLVGQEITAIDGVSMRDIFNRMLKTRTRDGNNLSMPSDELLRYFAIDYSLIYGEKSTYEISVLDKGGNKDKMPLKSTILDRKLINLYDALGDPNPLSFVIKDNIAFLIFPTFETKKLKKLHYKVFLKGCFDQIRNQNIQHLIIDVRNNGGGDPKPTQELLSYLLDKPFTLYQDAYTITNQLADKEYYKNQGVGFINLFSGLQIKKVENQKYCLKNKEGQKVYQPREEPYKGQVYVLINGSSFSATGEFVSFLKHNREVTFIGEEAGGNKVQNTSGLIFRLTLPHSRQVIHLPIIIYKMNVITENDGHGIKPDHWVRDTIKDRLESYDRVKQFTFDLIQQKIETSK